jgi:hypothetical protein
MYDLAFGESGCFHRLTKVKVFPFLISPKFGEGYRGTYKLNDSERIAVLKHETLHLVFKHLFRNRKYCTNSFLYNIAADLVVNQYIGKSYTRLFFYCHRSL